MATSAAAVKEEPSTSFAKDQLKAIIERIERLEEEKKTISDDIRDVYAEAKGNGFDVKALRTIVRLRKQDANERAEAGNHPGDVYAGAGDAVRRVSSPHRSVSLVVPAKPTDRANARPMTGSVRAGIHHHRCSIDPLRLARASIARAVVMGPLSSQGRHRIRGGDLLLKLGAQRSEAVCITKDCVASFAVADPEKWSVAIPACGSSEKAMAIAACGLTK